MSTPLRFLTRWVSVLLLASAAISGAWAQQQSPRLWNPADKDAQYQQRKQRAAATTLASSPRQQPGPVPGRNLTPQLRPACFEPFDTTAAGGWSQLPANDDGSFGPVSLGWTFSLFGNNYTSVYVNNNGNITFNSALSTFSASGFPISTPMIAAFWADVDTRNPASGTVWYKVFPDRLVVVWNRVGYFGSMADKKNTFQLVIKANTAPGFTGNDVFISYDDMQWTTGSASQGVNGFGGVPATVGANRGNNVDYIQTGRFNLQGGTPPNQPNVGDPGGIDWLDGQCLAYQVRAAGNVPPAVAGLPPGSTITLNQGETRSATLQFSGPEVNQTVSVVSNLNGLCSATATTSGNGGTNPTTVLTVTGATCNVGTTNVTFTATDNGVPTPAQSTFTIQVIVNPPVGNGQWTGAVSTDYNTAGNWSSNVVPGGTDDVVISSSAVRMPVLSGSATANSFTVNSGASMTIASGGALSLNGNVTNNGIFSGPGTLITTGASQQTFGGNAGLRLSNLTVGSAGLLLNTGTVISRLLTVNGTLAANNNLFLSSSSSGTAMVVNNGAGVVTGTATVQRYIAATNAGLGYRHFSAPVSNTTLADLGTSSYSPAINPNYNSAANPGSVSPYPTLFGYDQSRVTSSGNNLADFDRGWVSPTGTGSAMTPGRAYTANLLGNQVVDFVGTLGNGAVSISGLGRGSATQAGWHLLGNPYPAPLSWAALFGASSGIDNAVYVFKPTSQYGGSYASYVNGQGANGGSDVIGVAQGFFVRTSTVGGSGTVNFGNGTRQTTYTDATMQRTTADPRPVLLLSLNGQGATDQVNVYFENGATADFDRAFDAIKVAAGNGVLLALNGSGAEPLSISGLPLLGTAPVTVPLLVRVGRTGSYTLRADELLNMAPGTTVQLLDGQTGTVTTLAPQTVYTFTADASLTGPRFSLLFNAARPTATASALDAQVAAFPNPAHDQLWVRLPAGQSSATAVLLNALGQRVLSQQLKGSASGTAQALQLGKLARGVYTLQLTLPTGTATKRIVLE